MLLEAPPTAQRVILLSIGPPAHYPFTDTTVRRYALIDWDNTLRPGFLLLEWAGFLNARKPEIRSRLGPLASAYQAFESNSLSYERFAELAPEYYGRAIAGFDVEELARLGETFVKQESLRTLYPFAEQLLDLLERRNIERVIISGAPVELLCEYKDLLRLSSVYGLRYEQQGTVYTGEILSNTATSDGKAEVIGRHVGKGQVVVGIGDSVADLPLLDAASVRVLVGDGLRELEPYPETFRIVPTRSGLDDTLHAIDGALTRVMSA